MRTRKHIYKKEVSLLPPVPQVPSSGKAILCVPSREILGLYKLI